VARVTEKIPTGRAQSQRAFGNWSHAPSTIQGCGGRLYMPAEQQVAVSQRFSSAGPIQSHVVSWGKMTELTTERR
jgi:hypothetical protein